MFLHYFALICWYTTFIGVKNTITKSLFFKGIIGVQLANIVFLSQLALSKQFIYRKLSNCYKRFWCCFVRAIYHLERSHGKSQLFNITIYYANKPFFLVNELALCSLTWLSFLQKYTNAGCMNTNNNGMFKNGFHIRFRASDILRSISTFRIFMNI